jgi:CRP-like cAMP-binding protein
MVGDTSGTDALTETLNTRARQFRACPTFSKLCADELAQIAAVATDVNIDSGHVFIRQDDNSDCFYVIVSGQVLVFGVFDSGNGEMTHSPLATLGPGETIGEMGYFSGGRRTASARALEPTHMLRLGYDQLPAIFDSIPSLAAGFLSIITQRLRELNFQYHASAHRRRSAERSLKHLGEYLDQSGHLDLRLDIEQGIEVLIKRVVTTASKVMNADRATLFLRDPSTGDLWSKVAEGENTREIRVPSGRGLVGWVAANGQLLNVPDAYQDERFNVEVDLRTGYRTRSILCGAVRNM